MDYRQRIIKEASVMFRTFGIKAVTMDMIAGQMGISKRTIYEVFKDKDEMLQAVMKTMAEEEKGIFSEVFNESGNVIEAIFRFMKILKDQFQDFSPSFRLDIKRIHYDLLKNLKSQKEIQFCQNSSEIFKRGMEEGIFRSDLNIEITSKFMLEITKISFEKEEYPQADFNNDDMIRNVFINYLRGISTQKGIDLIDLYEKNNK